MTIAIISLSPFLFHPLPLCRLIRAQTSQPDCEEINSVQTLSCSSPPAFLLPCLLWLVIFLYYLLLLFIWHFDLRQYQMYWFGWIPVLRRFTADQGQMIYRGKTPFILAGWKKELGVGYQLQWAWVREKTGRFSYEIVVREFDLCACFPLDSGEVTIRGLEPLGRPWESLVSLLSCVQHRWSKFISNCWAGRDGNRGVERLHCFLTLNIRDFSSSKQFNFLLFVWMICSF